LAAQYNQTDNINLKTIYKGQLEQELGIHASEYSSVGLDYDFILDNNGTIDSLHQQIESIINR